MEGSNLSDNSMDGPDFGVFCFCGEPTRLRKSGTQKNLGRRLFGCGKYKTKMDCGFFCWYEPSIWQERSDLGPMRVQLNVIPSRTLEQQSDSSSSMCISPELQIKMEAMQKEIHELQLRNGGKMYWKLLGIILLFFVGLKWQAIMPNLYAP